MKSVRFFSFNIFSTAFSSQKYDSYKACQFNNSHSVEQQKWSEINNFVGFRRFRRTGIRGVLCASLQVPDWGRGWRGHRSAHLGAEGYLQILWQRWYRLFQAFISNPPFSQLLLPLSFLLYVNYCEGGGHNKNSIIVSGPILLFFA